MAEKVQIKVWKELSNSKFSIKLKGLGIILRKLYTVRGAINILKEIKSLLIK